MELKKKIEGRTLRDINGLAEDEIMKEISSGFPIDSLSTLFLSLSKQ